MTNTERSDSGRYTDALAWRELVEPQIADAVDAIRKAHLAAPLISLERVKLERALDAAEDALVECRYNVKLARRYLTEGKRS